MFRFLGDIAFRVRALLRRGDADRDLRDELAHHLRLDIQHLRASGMSEADAEREARRRLGSMTVQAETARDGWGVRMATEFAADVRNALRQMRRRPGYTAIAVLTVGLGIGATVGLASVANGLLLHSLPYADEQRIHVFWQDFWWRGDEYDFLRERKGVFTDLAAYSTNGEPYVVDARATSSARLLPFVVSTASLFDVLGVRPAIGTAFGPDDDRPGAAPVIVISYGMWKDEFAGDEHVIGKEILISGTSTRIVGVMPKGFFFPTPEFRAWMPLRLEPGSQQYLNVGYLVLIGRARADANASLVDGDIRRMARDLGAQFRYTEASDRSKNARATPVHTYLLGSVRDPLLFLLAAVALLLLIASANTAALVLARTSDRGQEMLVRTAMGAGGWRLVRQLAAESLVLAGCAAIIGAAVATAGFRLLVGELPLQSGFDATIAPGVTVPLVAFGLAMVIACGISIAPARSLLKRRFDSGLTRERSEAGLRRGTRRVHGAIIAAQVALAIMLAAGAVLLIRSVDRLQSIDEGFDPHGVATFTVVTRGDVSREASMQFLHTLAQRVEAVPGVVRAGVTNRLPLRDGGYQGGVSIEGRPDLDGARRPNALYRVVSGGFFPAMKMRVVEGRAIDSTDTETSSPVVVVSESMARAMWPGQSALGKHVNTAWTGTLVKREVVGVAKETRLINMVGDEPYVTFVPFDQGAGKNVGAVMVVRTRGSIAALVPEVRRIGAELDRLVAIARVESMEDVVSAVIARPLRLRFFLSVFAVLAVGLSAVGVYGTVSYAVARRRAEFGIHMALGATPQRVLASVFRRALAPVSLGVVLGLAGVLLAAGVLRGFLYGVAPTDTISLAAAGAVLFGAATVAAIIPAYRASRTSPAESLRAE